MRLNGLGLAALLMAAFSPIAAAHAAAKAAPAAPITKEQRDKGMAAAPGLISAAGLDCKLADARLIGEATDPKTKVKRDFYELACTGNEGVVIEQASGAALQTFTCVQAGEPGPDGKPSNIQCALPGNSDPMAGLAPYIAKAGKVCAPTKVRALGQSPTNAVFELVCREGGGGYILEISAPPRLDKPVTMNPCAGYPPDSIEACKLTDRAAQLAVVDQLMAKSGKACVIKDRAFIGATQSGLLIYEAACQDGKGFILEQAANGDFKQAVDCASADNIGGGCKLTDARQAKTEQAGLYTTLAKKAGFDCQVSGYAPLPASLQGKEVVELACSNRPDGAIGVFGATASDPSVVYDCAHSELEGYRCGLTKPAAAYPKLTAELKALGKSTCQVSNARTVGVTAERRGYLEVACADGLPGYMIEYSITPLAAKSTIACSEAKGISGGCTLVGNVKK
ncbi:MAG: hypothetical protein ACR2F8_00480 [Caulobacteraceae bacterium]